MSLSFSQRKSYVHIVIVLLLLGTVQIPSAYAYANIRLSNARETSVAFRRMGTLARLKFRRAGVPILHSFATVISRRALSVQDVQPSVAQQNQGEPENIEAEAKPPMDKRERQRIRAALLAVVGIGIGGVFLVVVVLIWGARLRRRARKSTTTQSTKDEFWYLRSKSAAAETNLDEPHESTGDA